MCHAQEKYVMLLFDAMLLLQNDSLGNVNGKLKHNTNMLRGVGLHIFF